MMKVSFRLGTILENHGGNL